MPELTQELKDLIRRKMEDIPLEGELLEQACAAVESEYLSSRKTGLYGNKDTKPSWQFKNNIEGAAAVLGVDKNDYIEKIALKRPQAFYQLPGTIKRNFSFLLDAHQRGFIHSNNLIDDILAYPAPLFRSPRSTHLRSIDAFIQNKTFSLNKFFATRERSDDRIIQNIVSYYWKKYQETGKGAKTLLTLATPKIYPPVNDREIAILPKDRLPEKILETGHHIPVNPDKQKIHPETKKRVDALLKENGIDPENFERAAEGWSEDQEQILELLWPLKTDDEQGFLLSSGDIANLLSKSKSTVTGKVHYTRLTIRDETRVKYTQDIQDKIVELTEKGYSEQQIEAQIKTISAKNILAYLDRTKNCEIYRNTRSILEDKLDQAGFEDAQIEKIISFYESALKGNTKMPFSKSHTPFLWDIEDVVATIHEKTGVPEMVARDMVARAPKLLSQKPEQIKQSHDYLKSAIATGLFQTQDRHEEINKNPALLALHPAQIHCFAVYAHTRKMKTGKRKLKPVSLSDIFKLRSASHTEGNIIRHYSNLYRQTRREKGRKTLRALATPRFYADGSQASIISASALPDWVRDDHAPG